MKARGLIKRKPTIKKRYTSDNRAVLIIPCESCGEFDLDVIEVHHVVPKGHIGAGGKGRDKGEIICLCANCHKKLHKMYGGTGKKKYTGPLTKAEILPTVIAAIKRARRMRHIHSDNIRQAAQDFLDGKGTKVDLAIRYKVHRRTIALYIASMTAESMTAA